MLHLQCSTTFLVQSPKVFHIPTEKHHMVRSAPGTNFFLSCFSITVIKHHDQGNLYKEEFIWGLQFQGVRVYDYHSRDHGIWQTGMVL